MSHQISASKKTLVRSKLVCWDTDDTGKHGVPRIKNFDLVSTCSFLSELDDKRRAKNKGEIP
jgi:hypothetical protein